MLQIPQDLYPDAEFLAKSKIIAEYMTHTVSAFHPNFPDVPDLVNYLQNFNTHEDAEAFLETGKQFFLIHNVQDISIKTIMLIAAVEKNTQTNYVDPLSWMNSNSNIRNTAQAIDESNKEKILKEGIRKLSEEFNQTYGAANNFANFVEQYFSDEDKIRLVMGFSFEYENAVQSYTTRWEHCPEVTNVNELTNKGYTVERAFLPMCYDWKRCVASKTQCHPDQGCLLQEDPAYNKKHVRKIAKFLYNIRSQIVHNAKDIPLVSDDTPGIRIFGLVVVKDEPVYVELSIKEFERMIKDALKRYFDNLRI